MADEPIPPYGVRAEDVFGLTPQTERQTDVNNSRLQTPITEDRVRGWIVAVSAEVTGRLGDYSRLAEGERTRIGSAAATVVLNGAGHYLESARYPTRAGANDSSYAGLLWTRYQTGLTALIEDVTKRIEELPGGAEGGGSGETGAFACFPPPRFPDQVVW